MTKYLLVLLLFLAPAFSTNAAPGTPEATVRAYFAALSKGDRTNANHLTARFAKFGEAHVAAVTERYIELFKRPGYAPSVKNGKIIENFAVVVILESPTDPDPAYLIKQNGMWRVLPKLTQYNRDYFELPETTLARFRDLERWFRTQAGK